jgi:methylmalonyl-CoA mutase
LNIYFIFEPRFESSLMESNKERPKLFSEFPPVKTKDWEKKIREDLKGADYDQKLLWRTNDEMVFRPYYRKEDLSELKYLDTLPGHYPFVRGKKVSNNDWEIRQNIIVRSFSTANKTALALLEKGITSPGFILKETIPETEKHLEKLLTGIDLQTTPLHFFIDSNDYSILKLLSVLIREKGLNPVLIKGSLNLDPLGFLFRTGRFRQDQKRDTDALKKAIEFASSALPSFRILTVNAGIFHNAGASISQELAFALAAGTEYLALLTEAGLTVDEIVPRMGFHFSAGTEYFREIAKLRAARLLWSVITEHFSSRNTDASAMYIHSSTSEWATTIYDPYNNMLRATTGTMSAVLGGADSVSVTPFDQATGIPGDFGERIARNTQIILKEEAYLNKVVDPGAGSYYIEKLTGIISEHAWELFRETEKNKGILNAFKNGMIQETIENHARKRLDDVAQRKEALLGINQYPDLSERASWKLNLVEDDIHPGKQNALFAKPLKKIRAAAELENLRLKTEKAEKRPVAFLLTFGDPFMRRQRAGFSAGLFTCGGFSVIVNTGFHNIDDGVMEAIKQSADIVVLCSSDKEYTNAGPRVAEKLKGKAIIVIAGYPEESIEQLKKAGIEHFIHIQSNIVEELQKFQKLLKIN